MSGYFLFFYNSWEVIMNKVLTFSLGVLLLQCSAAFTMQNPQSNTQESNNTENNMSLGSFRPAKTDKKNEKIGGEKKEFDFSNVLGGSSNDMNPQLWTTFVLSQIEEHSKKFSDTKETNAEKMFKELSNKLIEKSNGNVTGDTLEKMLKCVKKLQKMKEKEVYLKSLEMLAKIGICGSMANNFNLLKNNRTMEMMFNNATSTTIEMENVTQEKIEKLSEFGTKIEETNKLLKDNSITINNSAVSTYLKNLGSDFASGLKTGASWTAKALGVVLVLVGVYTIYRMVLAANGGGDKYL